MFYLGMISECNTPDKDGTPSRTQKRTREHNLTYHKCVNIGRVTMVTTVTIPQNALHSALLYIGRLLIVSCQVTDCTSQKPKIS